MILHPSKKKRPVTFFRSQTMWSLAKFSEKTINNYDTIEISYENIVHEVSNDIDFILYIFMIFS